MSTISISNVSNPATVAAETRLGTTTWQFVVLRGVDGIRFAIKPDSSGTWSGLSRIENPERFGKQPTTFPELRAWVQKFADAAASD